MTHQLLSAAGVRHGPCGLKRWLDGDGQTSARVELSCRQVPLQAQVKIDSSGRIETLDLQPARGPNAKCPPS